MDLIILPGNSKEFNETWLNDSAKNFSDIFSSVTKQFYKHWETGNQLIDVEYESSILAEHSKQFESFVIYAKSAGTITALKTIVEKNIKPKACIYVGCPFNDFSNNFPEFNNWIQKFDVKTLFIQQTNDPFFKYADLKNFIETNEIKNYKLIEIPGDNHAYDNYEEIKSFIREFLNL